MFVIKFLKVSWQVSHLTSAYVKYHVDFIEKSQYNASAAHAKALIKLFLFLEHIWRTAYPLVVLY